MSEGGTNSKAEGKDSKAPKRHRSRSRAGTGTSATSKRRKSRKTYAGETNVPRSLGETPTPSPSRVSEASMVLQSNASTPLKEAVSSTTISIDPGADLAATRSATSTPVPEVVPENATTITTRGAAGPCGKSSSVIRDEKLGSIAQAAESSESTGITHAATDPDMAAAIGIRDVDESENVLDQSRPLSGCAPIENNGRLVMPPSLELPPPAVFYDGQDPTLSPSPKRKSRGQSTVTFGDAQSYRLTSAEPSTSEILGQGSQQLRILACVQLSLGALAFHYQSMRLLAPVDAVDHWCRQPPEFANQSAQAWKNASVPVGPDGRYSRCTVYRFPYSHGTAAATSGSASSSALWPGVIARPRGELPCRAWDYDLPPDVLTALNEWDLVCSNAWLVLAARLYTYVGGVVCAPFIGKMADRTGRRPVLLACAMVAVAVAALTVLAHSFLQLVLLRMVEAGSLNGFSLVSIVLLFEVTYEASRTDYLCGAMAASIICGWAPCLLSAAEHVLDRRTLAFAFLVPVSLLLTSFQAVRESSRWLLATGDVADFIDRHYATFPHGGGRRSDAELDRTAVRQLRAARAAATAEGHRTTEVSLQPGSAGSTIVLPGFVARTASLSALFLSLIVIMNETSECGEPERDLSPPAPSSWRTAVLVIPRAFSVLLAARFLRSCERKRALMLGLPLSCAAIALLALVELALPSGGSYVYVVVGELVLASAFVNLAFACVFCLELYATADRAAGFATVCSSGVLGGVALMNIFEGQDPAVRKMLGLSLAVVALLLVEQLPETKDARVPDALFDAISQLKRYSMSSSTKSFAEPRPSNGSGYLPQGELFAACD
nr:solute carrier family 22 member 7-like isoform X2 [Dermacentor andersoni]